MEFLQTKYKEKDGPVAPVAAIAVSYARDCGLFT